MGHHEDYRREPAIEGSSDRTFGLVFAVFFLFLGLWRVWAMGAGVAIALIAWIRPAWLRLANRLWTRLGILLAKIVNPVATGIMFFLVVTPMGLLMRLLGKDPLRKTSDPAAATYWILREPPGPLPETMARQF